MRALVSFLRATFLWVLLLPPTLFFVGATLNQLVLITNHDQFPVLMRDSAASRLMPNGIDDEGHVLMSHSTHLNFLGDVFDFHEGWDSVGDLTMTLAGWLQGFCPYVYVVLATQQLASDSSANKRY